MATVKEELARHVTAAIESLFASGYLTGERPRIDLAPPKQATHGDFACPVALALARSAKKNPREIATKLQEALGDGGGLIERCEIAGPGYLNVFIARERWHAQLEAILEAGPAFIRSDAGAGRRILLEYVSANPTGPLHIAHGRGAVAGDVIARLLDAAGFCVEREYYVNDLGHQTDVLARSIYLRYRELFGHSFEAPEDFYPGDYVREIAEELRDEVGDSLVELSESDWLDRIREFGMAQMMRRIRADLEAFGVTFDRFVSEREMTARVGLNTVIERLEKAGHIFSDDEGKKWFRSTEFGDDKDRVVVREDGRPTYFASDIAYHYDKLERGFDRLINVWGADHGGYITRVKAGIAGLGWDNDPLEILLIQMVALSRGGEAVRMGKRLGTAVWLKDVLDEAGRDATRYFFVMRRCDSQLDFDIDLATKKSLDNPVYYAQMGHARMSSLGRRAKEAGVPEAQLGPGALDALTLDEEIGLIKAMARAPEVIVSAAQEREPHQVVHYIQDMIAQFHSYFTQYKNTERVISDDADKTRARLLLCRGLQTMLRTLLVDILGVDAPEEMYLEDA